MTRRLGHHRRGARPVHPPRSGETGSVLMMVAVSLTVIVTCTALTVDLGRVSVQRRELQNVADATTLDLVRLIDGRTAGEITADPRWTATRDASLARNGFVVGGDATVAVQLGAYDAGAEVFTPVAAADEVPSAVQVVVGGRVEHGFAPGGSSTTRRAVGAQTASAGIRIGPTGARLDPQERALAVALVGDALGVAAPDIEGLAGAPVGLDALATALGVSLASPGSAATDDVGVGEVLAAMAVVLRADGRGAQADLIDGLVAALPDPGAPIALGADELVAGGADAAAAASMDALDLVIAAALVVAPDDVALEVTGLDLGVPGLVAGEAAVTVSDAPQVAFGGTGTRADTAAVELVVEVALVAPGLVGTTLRLTVAADPSSAVVRTVTCGDPQALATDVTAGAAEADIELDGVVEVAGFGAVADLAGAAGTARSAAVGAVDVVLPPDVLGDPRPAPTAPLDLATVDLAPGWALLDGLPIAEADLEATVRPQVQGIVDGTVVPLVDQAVAALDARLVQPLLSLLGASPPGAEVTPLALRCSGARLVA